MDEASYLSSGRRTVPVRRKGNDAGIFLAGFFFCVWIISRRVNGKWRSSMNKRNPARGNNQGFPRIYRAPIGALTIPDVSGTDTVVINLL